MSEPLAELLTPGKILFAEIEKRWIQNTLQTQREAARAVLTLIGLFFGFYGLMLTQATGAAILGSAQLWYGWRLVAVGPLLVWVASALLALFVIRPSGVKVGQGLDALAESYRRATRRADILVTTAIGVLMTGVLWSIVNLGLLLVVGPIRHP